MIKKFVPVFIMFITIILSLLLYGSEFCINNEVEDIENYISDFIDKEIIVVKKAEIDNILFVYFRDLTGEFIGYTKLYKGVNAKYQLRSVNYSQDDEVLLIKEFETSQGRYWAVFGTNYDNKIDSIYFKDHENEILLSDIEQFNEILVIRESQNRIQSMGSVYNYGLLDRNGKNITQEMDNYIGLVNGIGSSKAKAELFLLYIYIFMIIATGLILSLVIRRKYMKNTVDAIT